MRIEHVTILVKDKQLSLRFYNNILELDYKFVGNHLWIVVGDQYIHVTEDSGEPIGDSFYHFCIERDDIKEYAQSLRAKGIELIDEMDGKSFFVKDPDCNLVEFRKPWTP